ncbi:crocetin glucosyltransferase, chloroplastic-like [Hordeum vulgare]|uniref:Glycosyltransferase n=1 Tax=Hordeum vulgare subsp. vulgare TaxID=112509 RepID=A0A8I6Z3R7_HORVV|nr:UDP-glycosyltransferase 75C1-like [Hordeum vulgare subsp. vulgare]KAE8776873.1 crocetin glucosyltransferase, chloroplastic-like [Hordeum vulgare]
MENRGGAPSPHLLFVTSPMQGHINPVRRLAARVAAAGAAVTVSTAVSGHRRMFPSLASPGEEAVDAAGLLHAPFSDGYDDGFDPRVHDIRSYAARARAVGCETLAGVVARLAERGRPVTCVVYTFFVSWVPEVARASGIPSALFWIQPAAVFAVYYHYFHGQDAVLASCANDPDRDAVVQLPGLPPLKSRALPSVVSLTSPEERGYEVVGTLRNLFLALDEHRPKVLVNTFDALEPDALGAVPGFELVAVGPVVPDDASAPSTTDLSLCDHDVSGYMEWLDTKAARSVVYVSFGTIFAVSKRQELETLQALKAAGRPYLWVSRKVAEVDGAELDGAGAGGGADGGQGIMVGWCDQVRVLSHPAVGCFVTHCGWNSALESIACGVPVVAVPQWTDQPTVAWLVEECAGVGVRARADGEGVAERGELQRCVETVMGDGEAALEIRACAAKWMERAREAVAAGGTLEWNLRAFLSGF